ncbi:HAD family hydrolase [Vallicoccus soli]|uniref:HAD family hydrolase n=1 Tax=Vallicoccus soli TaxID=2339232 RepID=A0A3A3Z8E7_9ACTN|nr:HAD family hydrolase [Vallicoccus soli]RJK97117.1 HAD family hydrolase [Vallicoccus soli]
MSDHDLRPGVLLDVDGTLLDTNYLHVVAWSRAFRRTGHEGVSMSTIHRAIGIGSQELVGHVLGDGLDEEAVSAVVDAHSACYEAFQDDVLAFPRAGELVEAVAGLGLAAVLATSGREQDLEWMRPAIGAGDALSGATTSGAVDRAKPAPDLLVVAARENHLDPRRTVVVGDTLWDVQAANDADMACIALLCGGLSRGELLDAGAAAVYDDPSALLEDLQGSPIGRLVER